VRVRQIQDLEHLGTPEPVETDCLHRFVLRGPPIGGNSKGLIKVAEMQTYFPPEDPIKRSYQYTSECQWFISAFPPSSQEARTLAVAMSVAG
jgi:hypothetical protein